MTDTAASGVPTPELDKRSDIMHSLRHPHEVLTEFYDWLQEQRLHLCKYETRLLEEVCPGPGLLDLRECEQGKVKVRYRRRPRPSEAEYEDCPRCGGTGYITVKHEDWWEDTRRPEDLFEDFFGLDSKKMEKERVALLDSLRSGS